MRQLLFIIVALVASCQVTRQLKNNSNDTQVLEEEEDTAISWNSEEITLTDYDPEQHGSIYLWQKEPNIVSLHSDRGKRWEYDIATAKIETFKQEVFTGNETLLFAFDTINYWTITGKKIARSVPESIGDGPENVGKSFELPTHFLPDELLPKIIGLSVNHLFLAGPSQLGVAQFQGKQVIFLEFPLPIQESTPSAAGSQKNGDPWVLINGQLFLYLSEKETWSKPIPFPELDFDTKALRSIAFEAPSPENISQKYHPSSLLYTKEQGLYQISPLASKSNPLTWEGDIRPLSESYCQPCHGLENDLNLSTKEAWILWKTAIISRVQIVPGEPLPAGSMPLPTNIRDFPISPGERTQLIDWLKEVKKL